MSPNEDAVREGAGTLLVTCRRNSAGRIENRDALDAKQASLTNYGPSPRATDPD
jgi:hypothetical protein